MWLAAVCSLIDSVAPTCRLLEPLGHQREDLHLARGEAVRAARRPRAGAAIRARGCEPAAPPSRCARPAPPPRPAAPPPGSGRRRVARVEKPCVLVPRVRHPGRGAHAPVQLQAALEVLLRALPLAQGRGEHPEVAVGRAITGDEVADHHVRPRERLELGIHERRHLLVAERRGGVGQVRRAPPARATRGTGRARRPPAATARASPPSSIPSSASSATSPGRQGPSRAASPARILTTGASSASRPRSRRTLNIWIPYTPDGSRPVSSRLHSRERRARASASSEPPVAERDRRSVVLGHVDEERLRRLLRCLQQRRHLAPRRLHVGQRDERRHPPGHRLRPDLGVAQLLRRCPGPR